MAYLENKIGTFRFVALQGQPVPLQDRVMIDDRNGVNGLEFTLQGKKGEPFQMLSMADANTYDDAKKLPGEYAELCGKDLQTMIQGGFTYPDQVKVLAVRPLDIRRMEHGGGNKISTDAKGWCVCLWDLVFVEVAEE